MDAALKAAYQEQEMRVERMINLYRAFLYLISAGMDTLMFYQQGRLQEVWPLALFLLLLVGGYLYLIDRLASGDVYRPWLKYVTSTLARFAHPQRSAPPGRDPAAARAVVNTRSPTHDPHRCADIVCWAG